MPMFDFSVPPTYDLAETGTTILECPPGPSQVEVALRDGELFVGGRVVLPYTSSEQAMMPEQFTMRDLLPKMLGIPLVHPMLAQVLRADNALVSASLWDMLERTGGVVFPSCRLQGWSGEICFPTMFIEGEKVCIGQIGIDRIPFKKPVLMNMSSN